ncbi:MAG: hypothetical protein JWM57_2024 [Phycisphaerales bacterium]|nr:hypothetical protein [Phycisphaerales bacterium]
MVQGHSHLDVLFSLSKLDCWLHEFKLRAKRMSPLVPGDKLMTAEPAYLFVRVNGNTAHNDSTKSKCYVPNEPPKHPATAFDYRDYCLTNSVVRIGWPATGDLRVLPSVPATTSCYRLDDHICQYMENFRAAGLGDVVLMPDKSRPGVLYIGDVKTAYAYSFAPPVHPYECAHRLGVEWDRRCDRSFMEYDATTLGIGIHGGFWTRALYKFDPAIKADVIRHIIRARQQRRTTS